MDELLCCVCDANSAQEVQHFGTALVRSLQVVRERRHDITGEEMEALMAERDAALAKVRPPRSVVILAVETVVLYPSSAKQPDSAEQSDSQKMRQQMYITILFLSLNPKK